MAINPSPGYPFAGSGAPGTDINAGLAQVLDFTKIPELVYGPEIDRAKAQLKANQDKIAEDRKRQETLLKRSAEADLARNAATQAKLQANLERMREIVSFGNQYNIDLAGNPSPFVVNNPELMGMYKEFQQLSKDTDVLSQNELSTKQLIEKANTSIATGKSAPSSNYYKIKAAGDSNPSNRKALLLQDIGFDEGEFNELPQETQNRLVAEFNQKADKNFAVGMSFTETPLTLENVKYADVMSDIKGLVQQRANSFTGAVNAGSVPKGQENSYIQITDTIFVPREQVKAASTAEFYSRANTTLRKDVSRLATRNNVLFDGKQQQLAKNYEKNKEAIEKELGRPIDPNNPQDAEAVFATFQFDETGKAVPGQTINSLTGLPLRRYGQDVYVEDTETLADYFSDVAGNVLSYESRKEKLDISQAGKLQEIYARNYKPTETGVSGFTTGVTPIRFANEGEVSSPTGELAKNARYKLPKKFNNSIILSTGVRLVDGQKGKVVDAAVVNDPNIEFEADYAQLMPVYNGDIVVEDIESLSDAEKEDVVWRWYFVGKAKTRQAGTDERTTTQTGSLKQATPGATGLPTIQSGGTNPVSFMTQQFTGRDDEEATGTLSLSQTTEVTDERLRDIYVFVPVSETLPRGDANWQLMQPYENTPYRTVLGAGSNVVARTAYDAVGTFNPSK
jgi:hypothetical protein